MVKDFKGQVKVADVQAAFDEIVGKVNSLVESYNIQGSVEDIDYTIGGANLAPSGYTLSVGGMKQFLKACEGCVVGGKPFRVDDTHIKLSTGMVVSLAGIQKLPDSVLEVKGQTLWWDSYNKRYTWTGNVPRKDYFTFKQEGGIWYTYLKKGTYTVTYRNQSTGEYEPRQITLNEDLRFPLSNSSVETDILKPSSAGEVPITVITNAGVQQKNTGINTGYLYGTEVYSGNNFSSIVKTSHFVTITPKDTTEGLMNEELTYTWRIPYQNIYTGRLSDLYLHFNVEVTRTNSDGSEEVLDTTDFRYDVPNSSISETKTFSRSISLDRPLEHGETIDITISDIDSRFIGQGDAWGWDKHHGIWGIGSPATMDVHLYSQKSVSFTKKINLIVDSLSSKTLYTLDSVEGLYDNYSDLGYFTWDTKVYSDRPTEWSYVDESGSSKPTEMSEGVYRVCDINMNSSSKFVGTSIDTQNEQINGTYKITNENKNYSEYWVKHPYDIGDKYWKSPWYQELDTDSKPKFVISLPTVTYDDNDISISYLFGERVYVNEVQRTRANQYWLPASYLYVPKGVSNPYSYYTGSVDSTNPKYSSQKVLNVKIDKQIKSENK